MLDNLFEGEGDPAMIQRLKTMFDQDDLSVNLNSLTTSAAEVASVAKLIKIFFTELPEPLIPDSIAFSLAQVASMDDEAFLTSGCEELLKKLSEWSVRTLKKLLACLEQISEKSSDAKGKRVRLARVFAPLIMRSPATDGQAEIITFLIGQSKTIFKVGERQGQ